MSKKSTSLWVFVPLVGFVALAILLASGLGRNPERYILEWDSDGLIDWTEMSGDLQPYCRLA